MRKTTSEELGMQPKQFRELVRRAEWTDYTMNVCRNYAQFNLAIVPKDYAFDFFHFCQRNPRPCPIVDVTEPGSPHPKLVAPNADLRTDLPRYRVFIDGELIDEPTDVTRYWSDDLVGFLIGCGITVGWALKAANVDYRSLGAYVSSIPCAVAGPFGGPMVVSGRAFKGSRDAVRATQVASRYLASHGPPIHIGDPAAIGVDITKPSVSYDQLPRPEDVLLWWGCGITPQYTAVAAKMPILITHKGGYMLVSDVLAEELANL